MGKTMKVARIKVLKFMFSKKATKNDEIFTVDLTPTTGGLTRVSVLLTLGLTLT